MLPFDNLEQIKTQKKLSDSERIKSINAELDVFLESISFNKMQATLRNFDVFYRARNDNQAVERFIEYKIGWSTLLREHGIDSSRRVIPRETIEENLIEYSRSVSPDIFSRESFFKYYADKHGVSPRSAVDFYYWTSLIKTTGVEDFIQKAKYDLLRKLRDEFIIECERKKTVTAFKDFQKYVFEVNPNLSTFCITSKKNGWSLFLKEGGVNTTVKQPTLSDDELLDILYDVYKRNGNKQPTQKMVENLGHGSATFTIRFRGWYEALKKMYSKYGIPSKIKKSLKHRKNRIDRTGDKIPHLENIGLLEGPINEQGVVGLFYKIHFLLGFPKIIKGQTQFPDCYAISMRDKVKKRVFIEFKFKSSDWIKSRKSPETWNTMVQYLICWEHDSKDFEEKCYKVELIELKKEVLKDDFLSRISNYYRTEEIMKESGK